MFSPHDLEFLLSTENVLVDGQQFMIILDQCSSIVLYGIVKQGNIFKIIGSDLALDELIIVQVEDPEGWKMDEFEGQVREVVRGEVQLYQRYTFVYSRHFRWLYLCASQNEQLQTSRLLYKLTYLQLLLLVVAPGCHQTDKIIQHPNEHHKQHQTFLFRSKSPYHCQGGPDFIRYKEDIAGIEIDKALQTSLDLFSLLVLLQRLIIIRKAVATNFIVTDSVPVIKHIRSDIFSDCSLVDSHCAALGRVAERVLDSCRHVSVTEPRGHANGCLSFFHPFLLQNVAGPCVEKHFTGTVDTYTPLRHVLALAGFQITLDTLVDVLFSYLGRRVTLLSLLRVKFKPTQKRTHTHYSALLRQARQQGFSQFHWSYGVCFQGLPSICDVRDLSAVLGDDTEACVVDEDVDFPAFFGYCLGEYFDAFLALYFQLVALDLIILVE